MFNHLRKAVVAALAAGALMLAGVAAHATTAPDSIVDTNKTGTIYLTKYDDSKGVGEIEANGAKNDTVGAKAIEGIQFTLQKIKDVDFKTNDGLKAAAALDPNNIPAENLEAVDKGVQNTAADGTIKFENLPVGAYLLTETNSTAKDGKTYKGAAPSIIFLPTTDPANQEKWLMDEKGYAVWVYPKNSLDENVKSVVDKGVHAGGDVTFTVEASMPTPGKDEKINDFAFYDKLDPALDINGKEGDVTVTVGKTPLEKGEDKHFTVNIIDGGKDGQDELVVVLTKSGLEKATQAKKDDPNAKAVLTFKAKVLKSAVAPNQAQVYKNTGKGDGTVKPSETPNPKKPWEKTNTTVSAWGKVKIQKTDEKGEKLNGAEFQIYACGVVDGKGTLAGEPLNINGKNKFVTETDGTVTIDGLHVNDAENDADVEATNYCLVETKAPAGFELRHDPIPVQVTLGGVIKKTEKFEYDENGVLKNYSTNEKVQELFTMDGSTINVATDVVNIPVKPKLPMTGGAGVALFGILGLAIIGGGVYAAKRNTKKA
ncbi:Fimbrial subunit type 1 precursor [Trueperella pyogenes]|uniref:SpaH/EbpB family LPXTG-anchored major pilin n=1 Tax=Trueperella pyogenes TaxID=1661 RepID=UPI000DFBE991|nr:SpaH/EbpB family LPXTG-anchored major pilin [Trueperella pyogenes]MBB3025301.1 LPXTG-motif cell wall-anchored protein [Trueperella pyogenes]SUO88153.1 Fimbrial subunit type 1 precursor [Trueperella pyogenes]